MYAHAQGGGGLFLSPCSLHIVLICRITSIHIFTAFAIESFPLLWLDTYEAVGW